MSRRTVVNLVWFGLVSVLFFAWAFRNLIPLDVIERPYTVRARFEDSIGVQPGNEVAYLGTQIGKVENVRRVAGGVELTLEIEREKRIPAAATAHLFRKSAIGEQYVDFTPPDGYRGGGPYLAKGAVVPLARTTVPLEFSELLRSASRLVAGISADDVRTVVHELATGLQGRTDSLRAMTDAGGTIARTLAARTEALDRLATNNTRLTRVVTEHRGALESTLDDLSALGESLRAVRGDLGTLLDTAPETVRRLADVVAGSKPELDCILQDLEVVVDETTTPQRLAELRSVLRGAPTAFGNVWRARDVEADGTVWVRVGFLENLTNPPRQYAPPKDVPPVKPVPGCASPLRPVAADYRMAPAASRVPEGAGSAGLALVLGVGVAAVVLVEVRRRAA